MRERIQIEGPGSDKATVCLIALRNGVTYQEDVFKLVHVVNTLGEELALHLVDDLVHAVSPVGHFLSLSFSQVGTDVYKDSLF